jgi:ribose 5-phosphate isomerase A
MVKNGLRVTGVPTSRKTEKLAAEFGIPLTELTRIRTLDLTVDGADEIDSRLDLIKGGGGSLLREKLVAAASKSLIIIADESKAVVRLGNFPLPVEIAQFGFETTMGRIEETGAHASLRMEGDAPFITDNGNYIVDCDYARIDEPAKLHARLKLLTGVVETGLFVGMADIAIIAGENGVEIRKRKEL